MATLILCHVPFLSREQPHLRAREGGDDSTESGGTTDGSDRADVL